MPSAPNPRTYIDKEIPPYDVLTADVYNTVAFMLEPPLCKVRQTTAQSIPNNAFTALTFQTEDVDGYNWHNTTNPTRVTPTYPGWYRGWFSVGFIGATGGNFRTAYVCKNTSVIRSRRDNKPPLTALNTSLRGIQFFLPMNGTTDYLEVYALQDSGAALNTNAVQYASSELFLRYWGPL